MEKEISYFEVNIIEQTPILFPIKSTTRIILTTSYHISIKIFPKSLNRETHQPFTSVYYARQGLSCDVIFDKYHVVPQFCLQAS